ncbi:NAD(P)-dependent oxidoreductase [Paenibacillus sacheonensis]|uniref:NAD(P)H-binding protein n=1 Tax=Paenibacillus sacheonensis TaxID=742054 RepID=A0A7X5C1R0_9BACL|nr:NAD(P)H-binding protein [Paenibacillus sacheonensis]MBM7566357.1 putative NADH-flavin reductase [Paenibacillus sacheonensis]NBC70560.1 NAD(P)H-binding protein [Paenibacillus sacheonensis]
MNIIVFGATGNTGRRALELGMNMGHEMTAFVRNADKFYEQQGDRSAKPAKVIVDDILNPASVGEALSHQDAAIIAAGHAGQGEAFVQLVNAIISQCERNPDFSGRIWVMGGAGLLDIPYTALIGNDLPGFPPEYKNHNRNYDRLLRSELDWSMMCPGTMTDSIGLPASAQLHVTTDALPLTIPEAVKEYSEADVAGYLFGRFQDLNVAYEDVVTCMLNHMELGGPYSRKRVGLAYRIPVEA